MPKYIVTKREVWTQGVAVDAGSQEEAIQRVNTNAGVLIEELFEYSHTLESSTWTAEEAPLSDLLCGCSAENEKE